MTIFLLLMTFFAFDSLASAADLLDPVLVEEGQFELKCTERLQSSSELKCKYPYLLIKGEEGSKKHFIVTSSTSLPNSTPGYERIMIQGSEVRTSHAEICLAFGRKPEVTGLFVEDEAVSLEELTREKAGLAAYTSRSRAFIQPDLDTLKHGASRFTKAGDPLFTIIEIQRCGPELNLFEQIFR
ncbi:MAG: hypothetical protein AB7G93_19065 [Bdellovibrionales bacterium]